MADHLCSALAVFDWFVLGYFLVLNTIYLGLLFLAGRTIVGSLGRPEAPVHDDIFANPFTPPVSLVMSAYNEELGVVGSTRAALDLHYPELEVVVVDDGSTDATFERLREAFDLLEAAPAMDDDVPVNGAIRSVHVPRNGEPLVVVRKVNTARRADGVNAGVNVARHPLVCCIDADSILERDALLRVVRPFVEDPARVVAVGGVVRAVNGSTVRRGELVDARQPRSWLARIQVVEYVRAFLLGRTGWSRFGGLLIISGAFGLFRRDVFVEVGGYDPTSIGEDADLVAKIHRKLRDDGRDYRVVYVPDPVCWTEVPSTRADLATQRRRWSAGMFGVLWKQRSMIGNPRYGRMGVLVLPYFLVFELLSPIVEIVGLVAVAAGLAVGVVDVPFALLFLAVAVLYGVLLSVASLVLEEVSFHRYTRWSDLRVGLVASVLENIGYRQLHAWWRLKGLVDSVTEPGKGWGELTRTGFSSDMGPGAGSPRPDR
jgi:cellulose synthase/poly-beta-1,6-N-acetylglucosamine synthase-like glycosyltransferase